MEDKIEKPEDIDWTYFWQKEVEKVKVFERNWDKVAPNFHRKDKKDDYKEALLSKLNITKEDTVLDIGCGEGTITIPMARKAKSVTGLDSSKGMLKVLNENCKKEGIENVSTIYKPIEEINFEELGHYDIVIASRSVDAIIPIEKVFTEMNKIANKYVYATFFGPDNWKIEKEFQKSLGKSTDLYPPITYIIQILYNLGICANLERLPIKAYNEYDSIEEAMHIGKFRVDTLSNEEAEKLKVYLKSILKKDPETGKLYNEDDVADWMLVWWKTNGK